MGIVIENITLESYTDLNALHKNIGDEFSSLAEKQTLALDDKFIIEDSETNPIGDKKFIKFSAIPKTLGINIGSFGENVLVEDSDTVLQFKSIKSNSSAISISDDPEHIIFILNQSQISIDYIGDGTTFKKFTSSEKTKLAYIEVEADKTDAANVTIAESFIPVNAHSDLVSSGDLIDTTVELRHIQGTDVSLGIQTQSLVMGNHTIRNLGNPTSLDCAISLGYLNSYIVQENIFGKNINSQFSTLPLKSTPNNVDLIVIEDSTDSYKKKAILFSSLGADDENAIHKNLGAEISSILSKNYLSPYDVLLIEDSEVEPSGTYPKKSISIVNFKYAGLDSSAFHFDTSDEFDRIDHKEIPISSDRLLIEDSESSYSKKWAQISELPIISFDAKAVHIDINNEFSTIIEEPNPEESDWFIIEKSTNGEKRKVSFGSIPTAHDADAIHRSGINEITQLTQKASNLAEDYIIIEQYNTNPANRTKRKVRIADLPTGGGGEANAGINLGLGAGIYGGKDGILLTFKSIRSDNTGIQIVPEDDEIGFTINRGQLLGFLDLTLEDIADTNEYVKLTSTKSSLITANSSLIALLQAQMIGALYWIDNTGNTFDARITNIEIDINQNIRPYLLSNIINNIGQGVETISIQAQTINQNTLYSSNDNYFTITPVFNTGIKFEIKNVVVWADNMGGVDDGIPVFAGVYDQDIFHKLSFKRIKSENDVLTVSDSLNTSVVIESYPVKYLNTGPDNANNFKICWDLTVADKQQILSFRKLSGSGGITLSYTEDDEIINIHSTGLAISIKSFSALTDVFFDLNKPVEQRPYTYWFPGDTYSEKNDKIYFSPILIPKYTTSPQNPDIEHFGFTGGVHNPCINIQVKFDPDGDNVDLNSVQFPLYGLWKDCEEVGDTIVFSQTKIINSIMIPDEYNGTGYHYFCVAPLVFPKGKDDTQKNKYKKTLRAIWKGTKLVFKIIGIVAPLILIEEEEVEEESKYFSVFRGIVDESEDEQSPEAGYTLFSYLHPKNVYDDALSLSLDQYGDYERDTININFDPTKICRLGTQKADLDMGNFSIKNLATVEYSDTDGTKAISLDSLKNADIFHTETPYEIAALPLKIAPTPLDYFIIEDSLDSYRKKKITLAGAIPFLPTGKDWWKGTPNPADPVLPTDSDYWDNTNAQDPQISQKFFKKLKDNPLKLVVQTAIMLGGGLIGGFKALIPLGEGFEEIEDELIFELYNQISDKWESVTIPINGVRASTSLTLHPDGNIYIFPQLNPTTIMPRYLIKTNQTYFPNYDQFLISGFTYGENPSCVTFAPYSNKIVLGTKQDMSEAPIPPTHGCRILLIDPYTGGSTIRYYGEQNASIVTFCRIATNKILCLKKFFDTGYSEIRYSDNDCEGWALLKSNLSQNFLFMQAIGNNTVLLATHNEVYISYDGCNTISTYPILSVVGIIETFNYIGYYTVIAAGNVSGYGTYWISYDNGATWDEFSLSGIDAGSITNVTFDWKKNEIIFSFQLYSDSSTSSIYSRKFFQDVYGTDPLALHFFENEEIFSLTEKNNTADNDLIIIEDSTNNYSKKKLKTKELNNTSAIMKGFCNPFSQLPITYIQTNVVNHLADFASVLLIDMIYATDKNILLTGYNTTADHYVFIIKHEENQWIMRLWTGVEDQRFGNLSAREDGKWYFAAYRSPGSTYMQIAERKDSDHTDFDIIEVEDLHHIATSKSSFRSPSSNNQYIIVNDVTDNVTEIWRNATTNPYKVYEYPGMYEINDFCFISNNIILFNMRRNSLNNTAIGASLDNGATWNIIFTTDNIVFERIISIGDGVIVATTTLGAIYKSYDIGISWTKIIQFPDNYQTRGLTYIGYNIVAVIGSIWNGTTHQAAFWVSRDKGESWGNAIIYGTNDSLGEKISFDWNNKRLLLAGTKWGSTQLYEAYLEGM